MFIALAEMKQTKTIKNEFLQIYYEMNLRLFLHQWDRYK